MAPLGVKVVTVILGGVSTSQNQPDNRTELILPASSYYKGIWEIINKHKKAVFFPKKQPVNEAAAGIVNDILSGKGPFLRHGEGAAASWWGNTFMPYAMFTNMVNGNSGLSELQKKLH